MRRVLLTLLFVLICPKAHGYNFAINCTHVLNDLHRFSQFQYSQLPGQISHASPPRFSEDSNLIGAILENGKLDVWNLKNRENRTVALSGEQITDFKFSPNSTSVLIFFGDPERRLGFRLYNLEDQKFLTPKIYISRDEKLGGQATAKFSPDAKYILAEDGKALKYYSATTGEDLRQAIINPRSYTMDGSFLLALDSNYASLRSVRSGSTLAYRRIESSLPVTAQLRLKRSLVMLWTHTQQMLFDLMYFVPNHYQLSFANLPIGGDLKRIVRPSLSPDGLWVFADTIDHQSPNDAVGVLWNTGNGEQKTIIKDRFGSLNSQPIYSENGRWAAVRTKGDRLERGAQVVGLKEDLYFRHEGRPIAFLGDTLVTQTETPLHGYHFYNLHGPEITSRYSKRYLKDETIPLIFSPDEKKVIFTYYGSIYLYQWH